MRKPVLIHLVDEEPIIGEVDALPDPTDQFMIIYQPRRRDGKKVPYLSDDVTMVLFPWHRIDMVQFLPVADFENIIGHVRE